jgi:protein arginine kinase activator
MLCGLCGKEDASVFVHQLDGGRGVELRLCSSCAEEQGLGGGEPGQSEIIQNLARKLHPADAPSAGTEPFLRDGNCPMCGASLKELVAKSVLGCIHCGVLFAAELLAAKNMDGGPAPAAQRLRYRGRLSRASTRFQEERRALASLEMQLDHAVAREDYEDAARLRDLMRGLETHGDPHG